jgi:hypothetical protein
MNYKEFKKELYNVHFENFNWNWETVTYRYLHIYTLSRRTSYKIRIFTIKYFHVQNQTYSIKIYTANRSRKVLLNEYTSLKILLNALKMFFIEGDLTHFIKYLWNNRKKWLSDSFCIFSR